MSREKLERLVDAVFLSGLWASYGDASVAAGYGNAARAVAKINWSFSRSRLGRADGTSDGESPEQTRHWLAAHRDRVRVGEAFGYVAGAPRPQSLRLTVPEMLMLLGELDSTAAFRLRVQDRIDVLVRAAEQADTRGDPIAQVLWDTADEARALLAGMS
jgi:hypothetical protein